MHAHLAERLAARIREAGPITVAEWMEACLYDPRGGYYTTRDPLGVQGDFTTAPEISQIFGELLGLWLADCWMRQGSTERFLLVELGPGRGTLMADALRATSRVPGFSQAMELHLVEINPVLRNRQSETLRRWSPYWADTISDIPKDAPLFFIANEFFDALPVRQVVRTQAGWAERVVMVGPNGFTTEIGDPVPEPNLPDRVAERTSIGTVVEIPSPALDISERIGARLATQGGAGLVIDYGSTVTGTGDTLQALGRHAVTSPFEHPGGVDLTTHVDFARISRAAATQGAKVRTPLSQGTLLTRLGLQARAQALVARTPSAAADVNSACHRLAAPEQMGTLFKAVCWSGPNTPTPAAFDTPDPLVEIDPEWPV